MSWTQMMDWKEVYTCFRRIDDGHFLDPNAAESAPNVASLYGPHHL
jgi:hypothetical protein